MMKLNSAMPTSDVKPRKLRRDTSFRPADQKVLLARDELTSRILAAGNKSHLKLRKSGDPETGENVGSNGTWANQSPNQKRSSRITCPKLSSTGPQRRSSATLQRTESVKQSSVLPSIKELSGLSRSRTFSAPGNMEAIKWLRLSELHGFLRAPDGTLLDLKKEGINISIDSRGGPYPGVKVMIGPKTTEVKVKEVPHKHLKTQLSNSLSNHGAKKAKRNESPKKLELSPQVNSFPTVLGNTLKFLDSIKLSSAEKTRRWLMENPVDREFCDLVTDLSEEVKRT